MVSMVIISAQEYCPCCCTGGYQRLWPALSILLCSWPSGLHHTWHSCTSYVTSAAAAAGQGCPCCRHVCGDRPAKHRRGSSRRHGAGAGTSAWLREPMQGTAGAVHTAELPNVPHTITRRYEMAAWTGFAFLYCSRLVCAGLSLGSLRVLSLGAAVAILCRCNQAVP